MAPAGAGSSARKCVSAGLIGFWPQAAIATVNTATAAGNPSFPNIMSARALPAGRIT